MKSNLLIVSMLLFTFACSTKLEHQVQQELAIDIDLQAAKQIDDVFQTSMNNESNLQKASVCETNYSDINFYNYDIHNTINPSLGYGYYKMVRGDGSSYESNTVYARKAYNWFTPPLITPYPSMPQTSPVWNSEITLYTNGLRQIAHRYTDSNGTTWELAGQPLTSQTPPNYTINVYADIYQYLAPIIMQPSVNQCNKHFYSDWWSTANPQNGAPSGYPTVRPSPYAQNLAYSWATIMGHYPSMTVVVNGVTKTYHDVVAVNWLHGSKYNGSEGTYPCDENIKSQSDNNFLAFKNFLDRGYNVYSVIRWYAKHDPAISQTGGLIKRQLRWYCQKSSNGYIARGTLINQNPAPIYYRSFPAGQ